MRKKNSCGSNILATDVYNDKTIYQPTTVLKSVLYLYNSLANNNNKKTQVVMRTPHDECNALKHKIMHL